jgi:hypothetical protein
MKSILKAFKRMNDAQLCCFPERVMSPHEILQDLPAMLDSSSLLFTGRTRRSASSRNRPQ